MNWFEDWFIHLDGKCEWGMTMTHTLRLAKMFRMCFFVFQFDFHSFYSHACCREMFHFTLTKLFEKKKKKKREVNWMQQWLCCHLGYANIILVLVLHSMPAESFPIFSHFVVWCTLHTSSTIIMCNVKYVRIIYIVVSWSDMCQSTTRWQASTSSSIAFA